MDCICGKGRWHPECPVHPPTPMRAMREEARLDPLEEGWMTPEQVRIYESFPGPRRFDGIAVRMFELELWLRRTWLDLVASIRAMIWPLYRRFPAEVGWVTKTIVVVVVLVALAWWLL